MLKKQGKESVYRDMVFQSKASFISCTHDGIQSIHFWGTFILLLTDTNLLQVIALNLCSKSEAPELFLVIEEIPIGTRNRDPEVNEGQYEVNEGQYEVNEGHYEQHEQIVELVPFSSGVLACINTWSDS